MPVNGDMIALQNITEQFRKLVTISSDYHTVATGHPGVPRALVRFQLCRGVAAEDPLSRTKRRRV